MSDEALASDRLNTVTELAARLAERMLADTCAPGAVGRSNVVALWRAAVLLEEHGHQIPPTVVEALAEAERMQDEASANPDDEPGAADPAPGAEPDRLVPAA